MSNPRPPRVLFLDIETLPNLVWVWRLWKTNAIDVVEPREMAGFSTEWLSGGHTTKVIPDYGKSGERGMLQDLHELLDEADVVVAHNGISFDMKVINARFLVHGFDPPSPYKIVDTLREVRKLAAFPSNKLDSLSADLDLGRKLPHEGFAMWKGCMKGEKKWWEKMRKYNRHDVVLLKKLYKKIAPWIGGPTMGTFSLQAVCPSLNCGSKDLQRRGFSRSKTRLYQRFQCKKCGAWGRSTLSEAERATVVR